MKRTAEYPDAPARLLEAAEHLFAEHGITAVSIRDITNAAQTNVASVHYHFGSKEELLLAVLASRIGAINARRMEMLSEFEAQHRPVPLEKIMRAFIQPTVVLVSDRPHLLRLMGRMFVEAPPPLRHKMLENFKPVARTFHAALQESLPEIHSEELWMRLAFLVGSLLHAWTNHADMAVVAGLERETLDMDKIVECLVRYASAGFRAPATGEASTTGGLP